MSESQPYHLIAFLTPLLFLLLLLLNACQADPAAAARLEARLSTDIELGQDVTIIYSDSAEVKVIARAPILENILDLKDPRQNFPAGLRVTFLDENQDSSSVLTAKQGVYRERKNQVIVRDSVVWQATAGQRLETDELTWDETRSLIFTDRFVVITQPDYIIYGYGLEAKQDFSDARIKQVTGRVPIDRPGSEASSSTPIDENAGLPTDF